MFLNFVTHAKALFSVLKANRPNKIDWCVYNIFRWWWNPILANIPKSQSGEHSKNVV